MNIFSAKICNKKTTCSCVLMIFESYLDILISYFTSRTRTYWFVVFDFTVCALTTYIWIRFSAWISALEFYTSLEIDAFKVSVTSDPSAFNVTFMTKVLGWVILPGPVSNRHVLYILYNIEYIHPQENREDRYTEPGCSVPGNWHSHRKL